MSFLRVYHEADGEQPLLVSRDSERIAIELGAHGVRFERWTLREPLAASTDPETVLADYVDEVARLQQEGGFTVADVIAATPDDPDTLALRARYLDEYRHAEDEARFFVRGGGIFYLHLDARVYVVGCSAGDLISVPAGTRHWFDMGPAPDFLAIRLFTAAQGRTPGMTGSGIAERFPRFEAFGEDHAA